MSRHNWFPKEEPPEKDIPVLDFLSEILGYLYNVMIAFMMLVIVITTIAICLFGIVCGVVIFCHLVVAISNPIPFIEQF